MKSFKNYLAESKKYPSNITQLDKVLYQLGLSNHATKLKINPDFSIDVFVDVDIRDQWSHSGYTMDEIPIKFNLVRGAFDCSSNNFTSLEGAPNECDMFICSHNKLNSLVGGPKAVYGDYNAAVNNLKSFDGIAEHIDGNLTLTNNPITTLRGIHKHIKYLDGWIKLPDTAITNILGLLKIPSLKGVTWINDTGYILPDSMINIHRIIAPYFNMGPITNNDILNCQNELIDAGFEDAAQF